MSKAQGTQPGDSNLTATANFSITAVGVVASSELRKKYNQGTAHLSQDDTQKQNWICTANMEKLKSLGDSMAPPLIRSVRHLM